MSKKKRGESAITASSVRKYFVITRADFGSAVATALSGNDELRHAIHAIASWLKEAAGRKPGREMLCLDCDATFNATAMPEGFLVVLPFFEAEDEMSVVTGICPRCCDSHDLDAAIVRRLRALWPDLRVGTMGNA